MTLSTENGWQLVPYSTNMADVKVDSKRIGFALNGAESDGSATLPMSGSWVIAKGTALSLDYDAVVSATSKPINEQVLTVVFVLDWAAYNTGESRGRETSHSLNYQKLGKDMPYLFVKSSVALNLS